MIQRDFVYVLHVEGWVQVLRLWVQWIDLEYELADIRDHCISGMSKNSVNSISVSLWYADARFHVTMGTRCCIWRIGTSNSVLPDALYLRASAYAMRSHRFRAEYIVVLSETISSDIGVTTLPTNARSVK